MPPQAAAPAGAAAAQEGGSGGILRSLAIGWVCYSAANYFLGPNGPFASKIAPTAPAQQNAGEAAAGAQFVQQQRAAPAAAQKQVVAPLWEQGKLLDVYLKLSTAEDGSVDFTDSSLPSVSWEGVEFAATKWQQHTSIEFTVPATVQHNASLWLDTFVTLSGQSPDPGSASYAGEEGVMHARKLLTRYFPKRKVRAVKNLLSGEPDEPAKKLSYEEKVALEEAEIAERKAQPIISYYHPNVSLELVTGAGTFDYRALPQNLQDEIKIVPGGHTDDKGHEFYFPITYANDFWLLREHMNPINETVASLPLHISLGPTSMMKFQLLSSLTSAFDQQSAATGGGGEMDAVKRVLLESNPWLLLTTAGVTVLHMLFSILAFTSDIGHWRNKKELVGVSVRTIISNVFVELVVMLYLIDESEQTSSMILLTQGTGLLIEAWKITKAVDIKLIPSQPGKLLPYTLEITDKHVLSEEEKQSQEYDRLAFRWVGAFAFPCLVGWTAYSLYNNEHKSWYSFVLKTIVSFVHMGGFALLIPQLIINYKLKSVAHLPLKTLAFKFLSTIVDDFFSFAVKMPVLHRIACFRDDVVFVVLMYQYWIYKVDYTRENEYGQRLTDEQIAKLEAEKKAAVADKEAEKEGKPAESKKKR